MERTMHFKRKENIVKPNQPLIAHLVGKINYSRKNNYKKSMGMTSPVKIMSLII